MLGQKEEGSVVGLSVGVALGAWVDSLVRHWMVRQLEGPLGYSCTTVAGNYSVIIVVIIGKDVKWVVIVCMALMDQ